MKILKQSPLCAPQFEKKLSRMLQRDFSSPHFTTKNLLKDVNLILDEGRALGMNMAALDGIQRLVQKAIEQGWMETDYSSIYNAVNPPAP
jgi:3-hydroxyisobutyrate dehydrogenase